MSGFRDQQYAKLLLRVKHGTQCYEDYVLARKKKFAIAPVPPVGVVSFHVVMSCELEDNFYAGART